MKCSSPQPAASTSSANARQTEMQDCGRARRQTRWSRVDGWRTIDGGVERIVRESWRRKNPSKNHAWQLCESQERAGTRPPAIVPQIWETMIRMSRTDCRVIRATCLNRAAAVLVAAREAVRTLSAVSPPKRARFRRGTDGPMPCGAAICEDGHVFRDEEGPSARPVHQPFDVHVTGLGKEMTGSSPLLLPGCSGCSGF